MFSRSAAASFLSLFSLQAASKDICRVYEAEFIVNTQDATIRDEGQYCRIFFKDFIYYQPSELCPILPETVIYNGVILPSNYCLSIKGEKRIYLSGI
ncbi:MAG: hypothetical protein HQK54_17820, partial [Oligoflexales bacterium]|nr:hypothetical protein [Oligoflexales bacterium]